MRDLFRYLRCRIVYGHVMVPYGVERNPSGARETTYYMCARCLLVQSLFFIGRDEDAE
jgi:hypothetical protein